MSAFTKILAGAAAVGLMAAPVAATAGTRASDVQVAPVAQPVSADASRAGVGVAKENNLRGPGIIIAVLAIAAIIAGIIIAADDDDGVTAG